MSIAVSAVVRPSRLLLAAVGAMCAGVLAAGIAIGAGAVGELPPASRMAVGLICAGVALLALFQAIRRRKTFRIDISGVGQIRLVEDNGAVGHSAVERPVHKRDSGDSSEPMQLRADSTIWPYLLLLRLQGRDRKVVSIAVLPDCVSVGDFRALSVACRWIAAQNGRANGGMV